MKAKPTMDFSILDTIYDLCPNDPAKAMTYIKECLIAKDINDYWGTSYEAQLNCALEGVDLISDNSNDPPIQSKTSSMHRGYSIGMSGSVQEMCDKAMAVDPEALFSFAFIQGSRIIEHLVGKAELLDGYTTRTGKPARGISFKQLRALGFQDLKAS